MISLNHRKVLAAGCAAIFCAVSTGAAETVTTDVSKGPEVMTPEPPKPLWSATLSTGWDSEYMFRGVDVLDGGSLQWTAIEASAFGFKAGAWFANGIDRDYNELDLYLGYNRTLGPVEVEVGYLYYLYPKDSEDSHELYGGVRYNGFKYVTPTLYYFQDIDLVNGGYLEAKLSSTIPVYRESVTLDPYVLISAGDYNTGDGWEWNNVQAGLELSVAVNQYLTITGYGAYSHALDAVRNDPTTKSDEFWGGARMTVGF